MDAVAHVVRCFEDEDVQHVSGRVDPVDDATTIDTELVLADMETVDRALDRVAKKAKSGDKEATGQKALLERCQPLLNDGRPLRFGEWDEDDRAALRQFGLLTLKKVLYVANVDEDDVKGEGELAAKLREHAAAEGAPVVPVCAKIESELSELDDAERDEMLGELGLDEPALATLARAAYDLLGLQSYFTSGPKEIRAWTVPPRRDRPAGGGRDPHRLRTRLHPGRGPLDRGPGAVQERGRHQGRGQAALRGQVVRHEGRRRGALPVQRLGAV